MDSLVKSLILPFLTEVDSLSEEKTVGLFGGGFQPPTKGHFEVVKQAIENYKPNEFIIFVGTGGGRSDITQAQSVAIWNIYKNYLPGKVTIEASPSPISSIYRYTREHPFENIKWFLGSRQGNDQDFKDFEKRSKAANTRSNLEAINIITTGDISGTKARQVLADKELLSTYLLTELSDSEREEIYSILNPMSESEEITTWVEEEIDNEDLDIDITGVLDDIDIIIPKESKIIFEKVVDDSIVCDNCGWTWKIKDGGDDLFICHKCGHDNTPKEETNNFFEPLQNKQLDINISSEPTRVDYYKDYYKNLSPPDFKIDKDKDKIVISNISKKGLENDKDFIEKLISLTDYMMDHINIEPLPDVNFVEDDVKNADDFFGKTAYYNPNDKSITLYTLKRHPKDVLRSFAHEMVHHKQNLEGKLKNIEGYNINEDDYLKELEREAYEYGNGLLFRGWENSIKGND